MRRARLPDALLRAGLLAVALQAAPVAANAQTLAWTARLNGGTIDLMAEAQAIAVGTSGNVYVAGWVNARFKDFYTVAYDADGNVLWSRIRDGRERSSDEPAAIAVDAAGNVFVTGHSVKSGNRDFLTVAYDPAGVELWARTWNGAANGFDAPSAIVTDGTGHVYVTGISTGASGSAYATVAYDASQGAELWVSLADAGTGFDAAPAGIAVSAGGRIFVTGRSNIGPADFFTVAYDPAGQELWRAIRDGGSNGYDAAVALAVSPGGGIVVTGESGNGVDADFLTVAYDEAGNEIWARRRDGAANRDDRPTALAVDGSGRIFVTGSSFNGTDDDYLTVAYGNAGGELWASARDGAAAGNDRPRDLIVASGAAVVVGESLGEAGLDFLTLGLDAGDGSELWSQLRDAGPDSEDAGVAVAANGAGRLFVTGSARGYPDWDFLTVAYSPAGTELWSAAEPPGPTEDAPSSRNALASGPSGNVYVSGNSSYRMLTIAYDRDGNELWEARCPVSSSSDCLATGVGVGPGETVFVTGAVSNGSDYDFLLVAYDSAGNELWSRTASSSPGRIDIPEAMAVDSLGRVFLTGYSYQDYAYDFLTVAFSPEGNLLWTRARDGQSHGDDHAVAVVPDEDGGAFVTGYTADPGILTLSYDAAGNEAWSAVKAGRVNAMTKTATGEVIIAGSRFTQTSYSQDVLTVAYDASGEELWERVRDIPPQGHDSGSDVVASGGVIYVSGGSALAGESRVLTMALDGSGAELWVSRRPAAAGSYEVASESAVDGFGNLYTLGTSSWGTHHDYLLVAWDRNGVERWSYGYDSGGEDYPRALLGMPDGGTTLTGFVEGELRDFFTVRLLGPVPIFADGFESGDTSAWSQTQP